MKNFQKDKTWANRTQGDKKKIDDKKFCKIFDNLKNFTQIEVQITRAIVEDSWNLLTKWRIFDDFNA
jgi:hypothetical protein